ncbi:CocE/NonD family hydrolase [Nakamurella flavida]|uniref:CocE/NonD family hydrolase n=2 Tax=Nakamurella flavida TaxID=363630 RepID=A0A938YC88_9ACTN|nr:CocE/NonD family hydrolase [Nakamurella flavida]
MNRERRRNGHRGPAVPAAGDGSGQRRLNGIQRSGREYRALSEPEYRIHRTNSILVPVRDGTLLRADVFLPTTGDHRVELSADGAVGIDAGVVRGPALLSFSCYPRQVQDLGAPLGFAESGTSDFFVPRGYAHLVVNARGTSGSGGTFELYDGQEWQDVHDVIEWIAAQPWCDGNVGGMGISYFALAQLAAATLRPPHLKAIFPFATMDDLYDAVWQRGVLSSGFFARWMSAVGVMSGVSDHFWRSRGIDFARRVLTTSVVHRQMEHVTGDTAAKVLGLMDHAHYEEEPFGRLWQQGAVEHPTHDAWWDARDVRPMLGRIDIPVYLGCQWDNVPMHLPSTFPVWRGLTHNPHVRMTLVDKDALAWPWESMHEEALAWNDQWLKGRDTGITDGPPIRYVIPGTDRWRTAESWPPPESTLVPYALCADGTLAPEEGESGTRSFLYVTNETGRPRNANPPSLPDRLTWQTEPVPRAMDIVGDIELDLDARITATDTAWIVVLYDLAEDATAVPISAGWLRATLRTVDEGASRPGVPVLPCTEPVAVPVGQTVHYRIPIVPNARRLPVGHRLQLVLASADTGENGPTVLGFTHTAIGDSSLNTVHSSSRLLLPVLHAEESEDPA